MCHKHARDGCGERVTANQNGRLMRVVEPEGPRLRIRLDGAEVTACAGDSVLVAVLAARGALRHHEFSNEERAGFCLMGACQDCWVWSAAGGRIRACTTPVSEGLELFAEPQGMAHSND